MCGRFALYSHPPAVSERLGLPEQAWQPRYNVSPGTWITAAFRPESAGELQLGQLWWGYKPKWAKDRAPEPINATVEKVATSGYFKSHSPGTAAWCLPMATTSGYRRRPANSRISSAESTGNHFGSRQSGQGVVMAILVAP